MTIALKGRYTVLYGGVSIAQLIFVTDQRILDARSTASFCSSLSLDEEGGGNVV